MSKFGEGQPNKPNTELRFDLSVTHKNDYCSRVLIT